MGLNGILYIADRGNYRIRACTQEGDVTTVAGNGTSADVDGTPGSISVVYVLAVEPTGAIDFVDGSSTKLRRWDGVQLTTLSTLPYTGDFDVDPKSGDIYTVDGNTLSKFSRILN